MTLPKTPTILEIDQRRFEIASDTVTDLKCEQTDEGTYTLNEGNKLYTIKVIDYNQLTGKCSLVINGEYKEIKVIREIEVLIEKMGLNVSHAKDHREVHAPMPGLVTSIKVGAGQKVEKGDPLMILEAMKMENVIAAPNDAIIKNINVTVGQAVERGVVLIEFDL